MGVEDIGAEKETSDLERKLNLETLITQPKTTEKAKIYLKKVGDVFGGILDFYFRPKFFEKSGKLYEALGVNLFGKYFPHGGSYWTKTGRGGGSWVKTYGKDLKRFIRFTKKMEGAHVLITTPFISTMTAISMTENHYLWVAIWGVGNFANIYSIMNQRYIRNRAYQIIEKFEERRSDMAMKNIPYPIYQSNDTKTNIS